MPTLRFVVLLGVALVGCAVYDQDAATRGDEGVSSAGGIAGVAGGVIAQGGSAASAGAATVGGSGGALGGGTTSTSGAGMGGISSAAGALTGGTATGSGGTSAGGDVGDAGAPPSSVPTELASGQPALSSTSQAAHPTEAGNDASHATRWVASSAALPQWWQVDLGGFFELSLITIRWEYGNRAYSYTVELSSDGKVFTPAIEVDAGIGPPQTNPFPAGSVGRYVRVNVSEIAPDGWASIYEVTILGT